MNQKSRYQEVTPLGRLLPNNKSLDLLGTARDTELTVQVIKRWVSDVFTKADNHHGFKHAQDVEEKVMSICDQRDIQISKVEKLVLRTAALLHDVGFAAYMPSWSKDRREHVKASLDFVINRLPGAPIFSNNPALLPIVFYLIAHHDDRNYKYPSLAWGGKVQLVELGEYADYLSAFETSLLLEERDHLQLLLSILAEADALTATGDTGAKRTFGYSTERGLPIFAQGNQLNAWCWEESAIGNVRIAAKGALTVAFSPGSKLLAQRGYDEMEQFIKRLCAKNNTPYYPETLTNLGDSDTPYDDSQFKVQLVSYLGWRSVETALRKLGLLGDKSLRPYADAQIMPRRYPLSNLRPTSFYVLRSQLDQHRKLQAKLLSDYALSLFDLTGVIEYNQNGDSFRLSPPIVETYYEAQERAIVTAVVDGLHRIWLARELGLKEIWVIEISDIPDKFPLVPLPLKWDDVRMFDTVPPTYEKRRFRFPTIESFPDVSGLTKVPITPENFLYFFYRDLSSLGSTGIRSSK